jgi:hypothetical protein
VPYVVTIKESGVYGWHAVADRRDAILHKLLVVDGKFKTYEFQDQVEKVVKELNKDRLKRYRDAKKSQGWLFKEAE